MQLDQLHLKSIMKIKQKMKKRKEQLKPKQQIRLIQLNKWLTYKKTKKLIMISPLMLIMSPIKKAKNQRRVQISVTIMMMITGIWVIKTCNYRIMNIKIKKNQIKNQPIKKIHMVQKVTKTMISLEGLTIAMVKLNNTVISTWKKSKKKQTMD